MSVTLALGLLFGGLAILLTVGVAIYDLLVWWWTR